MSHCREEAGDVLIGSAEIVEGLNIAQTRTETKRVDFDYADHYKDCLWRYYIKNNQFVSKK